MFGAELLAMREKRWLLDSMIERITPVLEGRDRAGNRWGASVELKAGLLAGAVASIKVAASGEHGAVAAPVPKQPHSLATVNEVQVVNHSVHSNDDAAL